MLNQLKKFQNVTFIRRGNTVLVNRGADRIGTLPVSRVRGLRPSEIMMLCSSISIAAAELHDRAKWLKQRWPGVTFGYLGNIGPDYDDTTWSIFLPHPGRVGTYEDRVGSYRHDQLPEMLADWPRLMETVERKMRSRQ